MDNKKILIIDGDTYKMLFGREQILDRTKGLAQKISTDYQGTDQPPILLIVLTGGLYFGVDLSKELDAQGLLHHVDTVGLKRYGPNERGGAVELLSRPHADLANRDIIVAEDVVDEGVTMNFLNGFLETNHPKSVKYCVLGLKEKHGPLNFQTDYIGFDNLGQEWLVGYGLDSKQNYRGLVDIYVKTT